MATQKDAIHHDIAVIDNRLDELFTELGELTKKAVKLHQLFSCDKIERRKFNTEIEWNQKQATDRNNKIDKLYKDRRRLVDFLYNITYRVEDGHILPKPND